MFNSSTYQELPEEIRHEMKQLACIANGIQFSEKDEAIRTLIQKFTQRCFDLIDNIYKQKIGETK